MTANDIKSYLGYLNKLIDITIIQLQLSLFNR